METFQAQWNFWQTGVLSILQLIPEGLTEAETAQVTNLTFQWEKGISQKSHFTSELLKALTPTQKNPHNLKNFENLCKMHLSILWLSITFVSNFTFPK